MDQPKPSGVTYQDYLTWGDEKRWEIIDGESFLISPAPRPRHQRLVTALASSFVQHLRKSICEPFVSPIDVRLSEDNVVQPDVIVVCDPSQVTDTYIDGPPKLVVEILSLSSLRHDRIRKLRLYAKFGVPEYWIVTPEPAIIEVLSLHANGSYFVSGVYSEKDQIVSPALDIAIEAEEIFGPPVDYPDEVRECAPPVAKV